MFWEVLRRFRVLLFTNLVCRGLVGFLGGALAVLTTTTFSAQTALFAILWGLIFGLTFAFAPLKSRR